MSQSPHIGTESRFGVRYRVLMLSVALAAVGGCAITPRSAGVPDLPIAFGPTVWPSPPEQARVKFVKSVAGPTDLGVRPSFLSRIGRLLVGKAEPWLIRPTSVAVRKDTFYIADPGAQAVWILDTKTGRFRRIRGPKDQLLVSPVGVALGGEDIIYVVDSYLRKLFMFEQDGEVKHVIESPEFQRPCSVAYDVLTDRLYVADSTSHRIWIFAGNGTRKGEIGGRGVGDGEFNFPTHVALDIVGNLYVTDSLGFRIQVFSEEGGLLRVFGHHGDGSGDFAAPKGLGVDREGHIYVVDALFDAVQVFDRSGQFLLSFGGRGVGPGQFWLPTGLFIDEQDRIYVADSYNQRIQIFQYLVASDGG